MYQRSAPCVRVLGGSKTFKRQLNHSASLPERVRSRLATRRTGCYRAILAPSLTSFLCVKVTSPCEHFPPGSSALLHYGGGSKTEGKKDCLMNDPASSVWL